MRRRRRDHSSSGDGDEPLLRYFDHVFPVRPGTEDLPLDELLDRQFYRLAHWRVGDEELNYRRFFDIDTLAGVRVEDEEVFAETHAVLLGAGAPRAGSTGLRIDHPDGLADPRGYLQRLSGATGAWIVVEKILEGEEELPDGLAVRRHHRLRRPAADRRRARRPGVGAGRSPTSTPS